LLVLNLVQSGGLRLQLIILPLGLLELGLKLVELIVAHIGVLDLLASLLGVLDLGTEGLELGIERLHLLLLVGILGLLQVKKTKVLLLPRYIGVSCMRVAPTSKHGLELFDHDLMISPVLLDVLEPLVVVHPQIQC